MTTAVTCLLVLGGCERESTPRIVFLGDATAHRRSVGAEARNTLVGGPRIALALSDPVSRGATLTLGTAVSTPKRMRRAGRGCTATFTVRLLRGGRAEPLTSFEQNSHETSSLEPWVDHRLPLPASVAPPCSLLLSAEAHPQQCAAIWSVPSIETLDKPQLPSVLLVVFDSLRPDHLGCYGYHRPTSPCMDSLARHGVTFLETSSCAPWTLASLGSILTSLPPWAHGAGRGGTTPLSDTAPNMVSAFKRAGYFTKAFSANPMLSPAYGTDRGFHEASWPLLGADELEERASRWLRAHRREPFFLLVFILDPHFPYSPPADLGLRFVRGNGQERVGDSVSDLGLVKSGDLTPEERARVIDLYDAEIAWADRALSRLLATLRSLDIGSHTVVAVTADHGEEFWDHGGFFHGHSLHQELLRVPLIVSVPWRAGESSVVREPVSLLDIAPTLLELAGLAPPAGMSGRSLAASFDGQKLPLHPCPAGAILYGDDMRALRLGKHKVLATLEGLPTALFDLAADPYETVNILASERALAESLASVIGSFAAAPPGSLEAVAPEPDEATQQALEALGYL